jgi:acyl-CoA dehydrogenase
VIDSLRLRFLNQFRLSDEEEALIATVRRLVVEEIAPRAEEYDTSGDFPWQNIRALQAIGLNASFIPLAYGGAGLSFRCLLRLAQELSYGCPSTAISWAGTYHAITPIIDFGSEEQKAKYLPVVASGALAALAITEASGGSDVAGIRTQFYPTGGKVAIQGTKSFITNGDVADLFVVFGKWAGASDGRDAMTAVIVEKGTPGIRVVRKEDKMGYRASSTVELAFQDCQVPRANVLGAPGQGFKQLLSAVNKSRPSVSAQALGIARAALDEAVTYINARWQFGQRIVDFQGVQFMLADMVSQLLLAESWLMYVGQLMDSSVADYSVEASILKLAASDAAVHIASTALQLHGAYGYIRGSRIERLFRDAKATQLWEGANELQRHYIGRVFGDQVPEKPRPEVGK